MKRTLIVLIILLISVTASYADDTYVFTGDGYNTFQVLESNNVYLGSANNSNSVVVPNPFYLGFTYYLRIMVGIGGGVCVLLMSAVDIINAAKTNEEDPHSYQKVLMKIIVRLVLFSAVMIAFPFIVNVRGAV